MGVEEVVSTGSLCSQQQHRFERTWERLHTDQRRFTDSARRVADVQVLLRKAWEASTFTP